MAKADAEPLVLSRQMRAALITFEGTAYFVASGFPECPELPPGLTRADLTPSLFAISAVELEIQCTATSSEIRDAIEDMHQGADGYTGHSLEAVAPLFSAITCFSVDTDFDVSGSIRRLTGSYVSRSYSDGPLNFSDEMRNRLSDLFESGSIHVPFGLVLQGVLSFSWSGFFVELYRSIEQLYSVPRLIDLTSQWNTELSLYDVADLIERTLSWRPKEDESLIRLLQLGCSKGSLDAASLALKADLSEDHARSSEITARAIYKWRNSFVHFRPSKSSTYLTEAEWDELIRSMISIIGELYDNFGDIFHNPLKSTAPNAEVRDHPTEPIG